MHGRRFDRILTGTAIALVLGLRDRRLAGAEPSRPGSAIEASVPMPEPANLPPPTAADVGGPATETTGSTADRPARSARPAAADLQGYRGTGSGRDPAAAPRNRSRRRRLPRPRRAAPPVVVAHAGSAGSRRAARAHRQQQARAHHRPQGRPHRGRGVLLLARLRAALDRERRGATERAKAGDRASAQSPTPTAWTRPTIRRRRSRPAPTPAALAEAEMRLTESVLDLCAPRPDGPRALFARQRRHHLRAGRARARSTC